MVLEGLSHTRTWALTTYLLHGMRVKEINPVNCMVRRMCGNGRRCCDLLPWEQSVGNGAEV